ncbi:MAG TPA: bifunctional homocysteine S-methyltransferase/methylenetetrahydrofolate reductase [Sandaracinaceae bacterium LLY-WYZ-13_1]|nr:bifunctional homocysteine S-methyltransferase/methylenetetrahydrofolate reductase [Sandaracinaceae bacterium LLY-WYZ-13_1]
MSESSPRREPKLIDALRERPVVFDGAMGTALYERGVLYTNNFDHQTLVKADLVRSIHQSYRDAGAEVLCTNTFGANRYRLASHNLEGEVEAINRAAIRLAREVADDQAWVAGSVGPSGTIFKTVPDAEKDGLRAAFKEQAAVLAEEGVDLISLETFRQPEELLLALEGTRAGTRGAVPVLANVSFDAFGTMADGTGPEDVATMLLDWGADAIGVNCADGPAGVYEMVTRMLDAGLPVVAQPNAGLPRRVEGRFAYMATPEYFLIYARRLFKAGVRGVGGCCGTTADHVRQIVQAARMLRGDEPPRDSSPPDSPGQATRDFEQVPEDEVAPGIEVTPLAAKGALGAKLAAGQFTISVEVNPPPGLSLDKALAGATMLREGGVDAINVADGARATARMGNLALCHRIQEQLGVPSLMHVTTRDRNVLGLVAHLLAAHELGVRNLIVITGDPPKMGDFPDATAVYDLDSIGLLRLIDGMNRGFDPGGKPLKGGATSFLCATGAEPAARDYDRELRRLEQKRDAGAELVMTQPVYDPEVLDRFLTDVRPLGIPVLVGLLPLASYRNAEFLHNEVPGMRIPEDIRERMRHAGGGPDGRAEGVRIAREMLEAVKDRVDGAYIMPPFARYQLALRVIEGIVR